MPHAPAPADAAATAIDTSFPGLHIRRCAGRLGGEVLGLAFGPDTDAGRFAAVQRALQHYKVLFFRAQHHLDDAAHEALGRRFGEIEAHPTVPAPAGTRFFELDASTGGGRADSWHTDVTFVAEFPKICLLRGVTIPAYGGDTLWADTVAAYAGLPAPLKQLADGLWATHTNDYDYGATRADIAQARWRHHLGVFASVLYETEHPVVHVHPETGERALLLGHFVKRFAGLSNSESRQVLDLLQARITRPENTVRWVWQPNDLAIWDNRQTLHFAINDYGDQPRVVRRVTVHGEAARAIDGTRSRAVRVPAAADAPQPGAGGANVHRQGEGVAAAV